ncbi:glycoside hydrolase family 88 protein [Paenibacillus sp. TRM 82003]|nr:glycoside hydrolase family 88 protein [Paenibacillus sp. TRM 82003]
MGNRNWQEEAWNRIVNKVLRISRRMGDSFPHAAKDGMYDQTVPDAWTSGFWPGILWLVYQETKEERIKRLAESCERRLDEVLEDFYELDHDSGFMWIPTSLTRYRLLGSEDSRRRALIAASHLAGRYNPRGRFLRAWNDKPGKDTVGWAIIDCTMNLPLLYWAWEELGDPRFKHIAMDHADTVLREFVREDGSVRHIVCFDPESGERVDVLGGQGYSPDSAWARGNAWALYGLALNYRYTGEARYLNGAKKVARYFLEQVGEAWIPCWDLRLPDDSGMPTDASAAAIAACGLLEIAVASSGEEAIAFRNDAERMLLRIYESCGDWKEDGNEGLVLHSTGDYPKGQNVDTALIYGDYFFVEAMSKVRGGTGLF